MSNPAENPGNSYKNDENSSTHRSQQQSQFNSNAECQSFKRPRTMTSRMGLEDNRSKVSMTGSAQPPCLQFQRWGSCTFGDHCGYVHFTESILGPFKGHRVEEDQKNVGKLKPCNFFFSGKQCPYGNNCIYAHEYNEKLEGGRRFCRDTSAISIGTRGEQMRNLTRSDTAQRSVNLGKKMLKTKFCIQWERTGSCIYGSNCQFAHGKAELQTLGFSNPPESLSSAAISAPAKNAATSDGALSKHRFLFKWTNIKKISEIYADWIETVPVVPASSGTVRN